MGHGDGLFQARTLALRTLEAGFLAIVARVQGIDSDGDPVTVDPVVVGGVDGTGTVQQLLVDPAGNTQVVGTAADDAPVSGSPIYLGARYLSDIFASALSATGDLGSLIVDNYRRLYIRDGVASDIVANANRNIPVFINQDRYEPFDFSGTAVGAGNTDYYFNADGFPNWSLLIESASAGVLFTITVYGSNEATQPDITLRNYDSVHTELFGAASSTFTASYVWLIMDTASLFNSYKVNIAYAGAATWVAQGKKGVA